MTKTSCVVRHLSDTGHWAFEILEPEKVKNFVNRHAENWFKTRNYEPENGAYIEYLVIGPQGNHIYRLTYCKEITFNEIEIR